MGHQDIGTTQRHYHRISLNQDALNAPAVALKVLASTISQIKGTFGVNVSYYIGVASHLKITETQKPEKGR